MNHDDNHLLKLKKMVLSFLLEEPVKIVLFGSRARGDSTPSSDVDIGIESRENLDRRVLALLRECIENSCIPYKVDIVDLSETSPDFRAHVLGEAEVWRQ
jgi:hypothetical protein